MSEDEIKELLAKPLFKDRYEYFADNQLGRTCMLRKQYRMHPEIMDAVNQFYDDKLTCGFPPEVQAKRKAHGLTGASWLREECPIYWFDLPKSREAYFEQVGKTRRNNYEVELISQLVLPEIWDAIPADDAGPDIGIITFYTAQVDELKKAVDQLRETRGARQPIRVSSIDQFQGMERDIIIVSMVFSQGKESGKKLTPSTFLQTPERINVAFSRARKLLVIVGSTFNYTGTEFQAKATYGRVLDRVRLNRGHLRTDKRNGRIEVV